MVDKSHRYDLAFEFNRFFLIMATCSKPQEIKSCFIMSLMQSMRATKF